MQGVPGVNLELGRCMHRSGNMGCAPRQRIVVTLNREQTLCNRWLDDLEPMTDYGLQRGSISVMVPRRRRIRRRKVHHQ
jgi:hypothetical protein